jgi:hypothetical protein
MDKNKNDSSEIIKTKYCPICKQDVDENLFYKVRDTYKVNKCKECYKDMMNKRYTRKTEKIVIVVDPDAKEKRRKAGSIKLYRNKLMDKYKVDTNDDQTIDELKSIYYALFKKEMNTKKCIKMKENRAKLKAERLQAKSSQAGKEQIRTIEQSK